uniref:Putative ovule protein n=1 Tax=Solanum chacoense TaxID=4108 RepID=A0A0V0HC18_SOLCH
MFGTELLTSATSDRRQLSGGTHPPYLTTPLLEFLKGGEEIRCSSRHSPNALVAGFLSCLEISGLINEG